ncbi:MAG: toprim domain-containing protein [Deltaproteobacteria bacterium]|nr:toprim domain-containing protein [Deltaproteobacteria bacterium]
MPKSTSIDVKNYYNRITEIDIGTVARDLIGDRITSEDKDVLKCDCPHHSSKSRRSLNIMLDKKGWNCFGCAVGGDVLQLVEFVQSGVVTAGKRGPMPESHRRARDYLATKAGLPPLSGEGLDSEKIKEIESDRYHTTMMQDALTEVARFYHARLKANPEALAWVKEQYGLTDETIDKLLIGYANNDVGLDAYGAQCAGLRDAMEQSPKAISKKTLVMISAVRSGGGDLYPYFERRVVFPYWSRGRVVFMIGRRSPWTPDTKWEQAKYKKLQVHDPAKDRGHIAPCIHNGYIYNEDCLLERPDRVVITEGVTDCIAAMQAGIPCISPVTTSFRKEDIPRLVALTRRIKQVVICNDSEVGNAGEKGALKTAEALHEAGVDVRIATIPRPAGVDKIDVCDLVKTGGAGALERVLDDAAPYIDYLIERIPAGISDRELMPHLEEVLKAVEVLVHYQPVLKGAYLDRVAKRFKLGKRDLNAQFKMVTAKQRHRETEQEDDADADVRPQIIVNNRQQRDIRKQATEVLLEANRRRLEEAAHGDIRPGDVPICFRRVIYVVRLSREKYGTIIRIVDKPAIKTILGEVADWYTEGQTSLRAAAPPEGLADSLLSLPPIGLPELESVIETPVFGSDGALIVRPGYHEDECTWLELSKDLAIPDVPDAPTKEDIERAKAWIFDDLFVDFPFVGQADRAATAAAMLLPFMRKMIHGPTPIHLIEAPTQGTGKGLICHAISIVATGEPAHAQTLSYNLEETRKTLTAELTAGRQIVLLDNADDRRVFANSVLASVITAEIWSDRLLGATEKLALRNVACWFLTGNNPRMSGEIARRCVRIRMIPKEENPHRRDGKSFKHYPLDDWVRANRASLLWSVLTLVQAWIAAGKPAGDYSLGSFDKWATIIGGVLDVAGVGSFLDNLDDLQDDADSERDIWHELTAAWWEAFGNEPQRVNVLNDFCEKHDLMTGVRGDKGERSQQTRLGAALRRARDRIFGPYQIVHCRMDADSRKHAYRLVDLDEKSIPKETHTGPGDDFWDK